MKVAWTEHAYAQLDEAMAFIARDRPETAMVLTLTPIDYAAEAFVAAAQGHPEPSIRATVAGLRKERQLS